MARKIGEVYREFAASEYDAAVAEQEKLVAIAKSEASAIVKTAKAADLADLLAARPNPARQVLISGDIPRVLTPTPGEQPGFRVDELDTEDTEVGGDAFANANRAHVRSYR